MGGVLSRSSNVKFYVAVKTGNSVDVYPSISKSSL